MAQVMGQMALQRAGFDGFRPADDDELYCVEGGGKVIACLILADRITYWATGNSPIREGVKQVKSGVRRVLNR